MCNPLNAHNVMMVMVAVADRVVMQVDD